MLLAARFQSSFYRFNYLNQRNRKQRTNNKKNWIHEFALKNQNKWQNECRDTKAPDRLWKPVDCWFTFGCLKFLPICFERSHRGSIKCYWYKIAISTVDEVDLILSSTNIQMNSFAMTNENRFGCNECCAHFWAHAINFMCAKIMNMRT